MFQRFHKMREEREGGFTLIELLVVILIIAILAAIAIPVFLAQREKGWRSQLESALKNAATAAESHATGEEGSYVLLEGADEADLAPGGTYDEGLKVSEDVDLTVDATASAYCISGTHGDLDATFTMAVSSADSKPTEDTCNGSGAKGAVPAP